MANVCSVCIVERKERRADAAIVLDRSGEQTCPDGIVSRSERVRSVAAVAASDAAVTAPTPASKANQSRTLSLQ